TFTGSLVTKLVKQVNGLPGDTGEPSEQTLAFRKKHRRSHMPWTTDEDEMLQYALEHTNAPDVLERIMGRSIGALKARARKFGEDTAAN
ncbi:MAG: hypothetical protein ACK46C_11085, partial [Flavobacteriales bacterium]